MTLAELREKPARVSPKVFNAYRAGALTLEQVQAFAITDDDEAQERVLGELSQRGDDPDDIRIALTEGELPASDKRARFVTVAAHEEAGGAVSRDLFAEGDKGVFLLDEPLLHGLPMQKLQAAADALQSEGGKWTEAALELDHETRGSFRMRRPDPQPMSDVSPPVSFR